MKNLKRGMLCAITLASVFAAVPGGDVTAAERLSCGAKPQHWYYLYPPYASTTEFQGLLNNLGITVAVPTRGGELIGLVPLVGGGHAVVRIPPDDKRLRVALRPGHRGYQQSRDILWNHQIYARSTVYHLYPDPLRKKMRGMLGTPEQFPGPGIVEASFGFRHWFDEAGNRHWDVFPVEVARKEPLQLR